MDVKKTPKPEPYDPDFDLEMDDLSYKGSAVPTRSTLPPPLPQDLVDSSDSFTLVVKRLRQQTATKMWFPVPLTTGPDQLDQVTIKESEQVSDEEFRRWAKQVCPIIWSSLAPKGQSVHGREQREKVLVMILDFYSRLSTGFKRYSQQPKQSW